jgi:acyl carrier protein
VCRVRGQVREVLARHTGLDVERLGDEGDLWRAGMTSKRAVRAMLDLEDEFGIEFPPEALTHAGFSSVTAITAAIEQAAPSRQGAA